MDGGRKKKGGSEEGKERAGRGGLGGEEEGWEVERKGGGEEEVERLRERKAEGSKWGQNSDKGQAKDFLQQCEMP